MSGTPNLASKVDIVTEAEADQVFKQIEAYTIRLEKDPTVMGPSYVHDKLRECRDFSNEVETLLITYYDKERRVKNAYSAKRAEFDARKMELIATDPDVAKKRSATDRDALANYKLKDVTEEVNDLKEQATTCQYMIKAIELRKDSLNRANNDIKKQVSLMEFARGKSSPLAGDYEEDDLAFGGDEDLNSIIDAPKSNAVVEPVLEEAVAARLKPHLTTPEDTYGGDTAQEETEDLDNFLNNITTEVESAPSLADSPAPSDDEDLDALFPAPLDEKPAKVDSEPPVNSDDDVIDIGNFLSQGG